jgi:hypothetical protein
LNPIIAPINRPRKSWTLDALKKYALSRAVEIGNFGRKTLKQTWLFGEALFFIHEIKKEKGQWMEFVKTQPYSLSTAMNAIKVFKRVSLDQLEEFDGMTASDLKVALAIIKMPPASRRRQEEKSTPNAPEKATDTTTGDTREKAAKPDAEVKGVSTKKCDKPVAQQNAPAAQPLTPEATIPLMTAMEYLHKINLKLEELERGLVGVTPDDHLLNLINQAIATLQRLRGDVPTTCLPLNPPPGDKPTSSGGFRRPRSA